MGLFVDVCSLIAMKQPKSRIHKYNVIFIKYCNIYIYKYVNHTVNLASYDTAGKIKIKSQLKNVVKDDYLHNITGQSHKLFILE